MAAPHRVSDQLVRVLERRMKIDLSVTDRHLFLSVGDITLSGAVERFVLEE